MTTLTDREKALVEAARDIAALWTQIAGEKYCDHMQLKMIYALRAYDPPKEKVYCMPEWTRLPGELRGEINRMTTAHPFRFYEFLREATAKEQE